MGVKMGQKRVFRNFLKNCLRQRQMSYINDWKKDIKVQNRQRLDNESEDENEDEDVIVIKIKWM